MNPAFDLNIYTPPNPERGKPMTVSFDEFVKTRIRPEQHDIVVRLRALVRESAPDSRELISYDMPCFVKKDIFAYINSSKTHLTFSFVRGTQINDTYGLLKGNAKHARFMKIKRVSDINKEAVRDYVSQAVALDAS
jgi:hypothetical protein